MTKGILISRDNFIDREVFYEASLFRWAMLDQTIIESKCIDCR